uniref:Mal, T cell differentiation protein b n=1 Tax=Neogobius melanostomus TaxID=47308 RepID=A0A8C6UDI7_9GOBI
MATTAQPMSSLPSGAGICTTAPDILYLPELVFGGLVWILVASTRVEPANPLAWVMFVSIFCFVMTFLWMVIFACGGHKNSYGWAAAVRYHITEYQLHQEFKRCAFVSAGLCLSLPSSDLLPQCRSCSGLHHYGNKAGGVFAFATTLLYFIHAILSIIRWKNF